jgi:hypothetical protein
MSEEEIMEVRAVKTVAERSAKRYTKIWEPEPGGGTLRL